MQQFSFLMYNLCAISCTDSIRKGIARDNPSIDLSHFEKLHSFQAKRSKLLPHANNANEFQICFKRIYTFINFFLLTPLRLNKL